MADSVYNQALAIVATAVKTEADAISSTLTPEAAIPVRALDWEDIGQHLLAICWDMDAIEYSDEGTSDRDHIGYPCYMIIAEPKRPQMDQLRKDVFSLKQEVRQKFNHQRTMAAVTSTNVSENLTRVENRIPKPPPSLSIDKYIHGLTIWARFLEPRG